MTSIEVFKFEWSLPVKTNLIVWQNNAGYVCAFQVKAHFKTHLNCILRSIRHSAFLMGFKPYTNGRYLPNYDKILIQGQNTPTRRTSYKWNSTKCSLLSWHYQLKIRPCLVRRIKTPSHHSHTKFQTFSSTCVLN